MAGDYFIFCFDFDGQVFFAYGLVRRITLDGKSHHAADYPAQQLPLRSATVQSEDHRLVGRISKRAFVLARMRHWPNSETGVLAILDYSAGRPVDLSLAERLRLMLVI